MSEIDPELVSKLQRIIADNPYITITELKQKLKIYNTRDFWAHVNKAEQDSDYEPDFRKWRFYLKPGSEKWPLPSNKESYGITKPKLRKKYE